MHLSVCFYDKLLTSGTQMMILKQLNKKMNLLNFNKI